MSINATGQQIKGKISDINTGDALIGASVYINTIEKGTVTDFDGEFVMKYTGPFPVDLSITYLGYNAITYSVQDPDQKIRIELEEAAVTVATLEITESRISEKQKESPLTVEALDIIAIKQTASNNFYEGLGALKGVDLTTASLGFTIVNTRGFNSTSPVRSLQIIDGVDNQSPGLNFSLGNFLGSPELDVQKVELVVGASSAFFGPNAFNGVIDMRTKDPFFHKGLSAYVKKGERALLETSVRYADVIKNKDGLDKLAFKFNLSYMQANDWEAENYDPSFQSNNDADSPGGYDAVNIYGDENVDGSRRYDGLFSRIEFPGLKEFHRKGYREIDLVDYNSQNLKANAAIHYKFNPRLELIAAVNYGNGTTVYQGENRFSLKDIQFYQGRLELRQKDKFFIRAYTTGEDAGKSYDAYFTALLLQEAAKKNGAWTRDYANYWQINIRKKVEALEGYPNGVFPFDFDQQELILSQNIDSLHLWHQQAQAAANSANQINNSLDFFEPGSPEFQAEFERIINNLPSDKSNPGTRFYDRSKLHHVHGEYIFDTDFAKLTLGANGRLYQPDSKGTIFIDTGATVIRNWEVGTYAGAEKKFLANKLKANLALRLDKNQNFDPVFSPAASIVYAQNQENIFRVSFSSAIRNPTLTDQYLNYNVGRAVLRGNINGFDSLVTVNSFIDFINTRDEDTLSYFNEPPIQPEQVRSIELGYRTTLWKKLWLDASYYYSFYNRFIGYKIGIEVEYDELTKFVTKSSPYRISANAEGQVTTQGFSLGANYYFPRYFTLGANYSWNKLNSGADDPIIPAFNTPEHKYNIGFSGRDIPINLGSIRTNFGFNVNYKWIQGFIFEGSPQFTGIIPTYDLLDAQMNFNIKRINSTIKIGASNILNKKQFQTYGGPRVGRLAYVSVLYEWIKK